MNFVMIVNNIELKRIMTFYKDYITESKNPSVIFSAKTNYISVTVYKSLKVMFQGKDAKEEYDMWAIMLGKDVVIDDIELPVINDDYYLSSIGSDEVGTGDFFGPITVCAVYLSEGMVDFTKKLKIDDSKKIKDDTILELGKIITENYPYSLLTLHNELYNDLTDKGYNMNKIKAYMHNKAIINLTNKINLKPKVIVDEFANQKLYFGYLVDEDNVYKDITLKQKAESKFASVAMGSIVARYAFLKHMDKLSDEIDLELLKGASSSVDLLAAKIIKSKGEPFLRKIAKLNFKTLEKARELAKE